MKSYFFPEKKYIFKLSISIFSVCWLACKGKSMMLCVRLCEQQTVSQKPVASVGKLGFEI